MKIIVTGGAGFIGGNFVHYMLDRHPEDEISCVDCLTYAGNMETLASVMDNPKFQFEKLDITDREGIYGLFEKLRCANAEKYGKIGFVYSPGSFKKISPRKCSRRKIYGASNRCSAATKSRKELRTCQI